MKSFGYLAMAVFLFYGAYRYVVQTRSVRQDFPRARRQQGAALGHESHWFGIRRLRLVFRLSSGGLSLKKAFYQVHIPISLH